MAQRRQHLVFCQNGDIPPDAPEYYFRMVDLEFTPRKVYLAVQRDATAQQLALPDTYGEIEAPVVAFDPWGRIADEHATDGQYTPPAQPAHRSNSAFLAPMSISSSHRTLATDSSIWRSMAVRQQVPRCSWTEAEEPRSI
jgi:hypothetical protein